MQMIVTAKILYNVIQYKGPLIELIYLILLGGLGKKLERKTIDKIFKKVSITKEDMANTVFLNGMTLILDLP